MWNLQRIKFIRPFLTEDTCHSLVRGLVLAHLDYANATLAGLPDCTIRKLERVQKAAARVIKGLKHRDSVTTAMIALHWLPVKKRIDYKIGTLVYKCLNGEVPNYLKDLLKEKSENNINLRSNNAVKPLIVPYTKQKNIC
jgi:hypothetical protein